MGNLFRPLSDHSTGTSQAVEHPCGFDGANSTATGGRQRILAGSLDTETTLGFNATMESAGPTSGI